MALTPNIRITFTSVDVRRDAPDWGPSQWTFNATVGGNTVGDPATEFEAAMRVPIDLPDDQWQTEVDVSALDRLDIVFAGTAHHEGNTRDLGRTTLRLRFPFAEREQVLSNRFFAVTVRVELLVDGAYGGHGANEIFANRAVSGQTVWTTVSGRSFITRLEFCEVRPTPSDGALPPRPVQPAGVAASQRNGAGRRRITATDPINFIRNPAVIPILPADEATEDTAACIEYSYYRPRTLAFADDDERLQWSWTSLSGGARIAFVSGDKGLKIFLNGLSEGEVLLECSMEGVVLAQYRALVRPMHDITCRFNILNGPLGAIPRSTPAHVEGHMKVANIFLRQAGVQLALDTDATTTDGAVASDIPGIFRISVGAGTTFGIAVADFPRCCRLNYRAGVMNFAYIHSDAGGFLGMATDIPANTNAPSITDNGTPSTSWKQPSGIRPDRAATAKRMNMFARKQRTAHPQLFAMYVTDGNGSPGSARDALTYAGTIAHELGHVLGLRHRVGPGHDGLLFPWDQNLMHNNNPSTLAQDIDIIQSKAILGSPAVT